MQRAQATAGIESKGGHLYLRNQAGSCTEEEAPNWQTAVQSVQIPADKLHTGGYIVIGMQTISICKAPADKEVNLSCVKAGGGLQFTSRQGSRFQAISSTTSQQASSVTKELEAKDQNCFTSFLYVPSAGSAHRYLRSSSFFPLPPFPSTRTKIVHGD